MLFLLLVLLADTPLLVFTAIAACLVNDPRFLAIILVDIDPLLLLYVYIRQLLPNCEDYYYCTEDLPSLACPPKPTVA